jgi:hypothetical protein
VPDHDDEVRIGDEAKRGREGMGGVGVRGQDDDRAASMGDGKRGGWSDDTTTMDKQWGQAR